MKTSYPFSHFIRYFPHYTQELPILHGKLAQELLKGNYDLGCIMGVATYDNVKIKEIHEYLPTALQIRQQIEIAEQEYNLNLCENKNNF